MTSITIPEGVTSIGYEAFCGCSSLTSVTIPSSVTNIGYCTFLYCNNLINIMYNGTQSQWNRINKGWGWNDSAIKTVTCTDGVITL